MVFYALPEGRKVVSENKNRDIEALRAIGIIFVLIAHAYKLTPWQGALNGSLHDIYYYFGLWTGVDLFFCVSGFIITKNIIDNNVINPNTANINGFIKFALPFWINRIYRLWPSAWFWLTVVTVLSIFFNKSGSFGNIINQIMYQLYAMLNVANFYGYECVVSSGGFKTCGVYQVFWSLSLEEQFYWAFPFIIYFLGKKKTFIVALCIFAIQVPLDRGGSFLGFIRTDAISLGVAIGVMSTASWYKSLTPKLLDNKVASFFTFLLLIIALALLGSYKTIAVGFSTGMVAIVSGLLVWISSYNKSYICPKGVIGSIVLWFGSRSYSLYLAHIPSYYITLEIAYRLSHGDYRSIPHPTIILILSGFSLAVILAELSFRLIENPLRKVGREKAKAI